MNKYIYDKKKVSGTKSRTIIIFLAYHSPKMSKNQSVFFLGGEATTFAIHKEHKRVFYTSLLTSCKLDSYLADINEQAEDMYFLRLVKQMAESEGFTERLKSEISI